MGRWGISRPGGWILRGLFLSDLGRDNHGGTDYTEKHGGRGEGCVGIIKKGRNTSEARITQRDTENYLGLLKKQSATYTIS